MKHSQSLVAAIVCLAMAGKAMAYPSAGLTGTGVLPSAAVAGEGQLNIAADGYGAQQVDQLTLPIRLEYGAAKNVEVGGGVTTGDTTAWNVNGKISYPALERGGVSWGVSSRYASIDSGDFSRDAFQVYGVATKDFHSNGTDLRGSAGINSTDIHFDGISNDSSSAFRPFLSVNLSFRNRMNLAFDCPIQK